jgi:hypothetical protein
VYPAAEAVFSIERSRSPKYGLEIADSASPIVVVRAVASERATVFGV